MSVFNILPKRNKVKPMALPAVDAGIFEMITYLKTSLIFEEDHDLCIIEYSVKKDGKRGFPNQAHSVTDTEVVEAMILNPIKYSEVKLKFDVGMLKVLLRVFISNPHTIHLGIYLNFFIWTQSPKEVMKFIHLNLPRHFLRMNFVRDPNFELEKDERMINMQKAHKISFKDAKDLLEINQICFKQSFEESLEKYNYEMIKGK